MAAALNIGISLTGGGARGSYQAGVLVGLGEILAEQKLVGENNPLKLWAGVSAGSINSCACVSGIEDFPHSTQRLAELWRSISPENVYRTDFGSLTANGARWIRDLTFGPLFENRLARSLLDTSPLRVLIESNLNFAKIRENFKKGLVKGLACSAYSYTDHRTVTFLQMPDSVGWKKERRYSKKSEIGVDEILASCAIPILFPSVPLDKEYFADGGFRNTSPISPVIHMGAKKILVVGVRGPNEIHQSVTIGEPTVAKVAGTILNALFFDTTDIDVERVHTVNEMVAAMHKDIVTSRSDYTVLDLKVIKPTRDIAQMAREQAKNFPRMISFLVGGLGPLEDSAELASYILFTPLFTSQLLELGYNDVRARRAELISWFEKNS